MSDLFDAISRGDSDAVHTALAAGADPNAKHQGLSPFDAAIRAKQPAIARLLLHAGVNAQKFLNYLCAAIELKDPELVRALLDAGADPNMNPPGGRPLHFAVKARAPEIVRFLIEAGADVNAGGRLTTPLGEAAKLGVEEIAILLIEAGAWGDSDDASPPPIAVAAGKGQTRIVDALLQRGANPGCRATLTEAVLRDSGDLRGMALVAATKNVLYKNAPLVHIAAGEGHAELVQLLLDAGGDPSLPDDDGHTALEVAQSRGQSQTAELLRKTAVGAAPAQVSPNLALLIAARAGDAQGVQQALSQGAELNTQDSHRETLGMTPLMLAAANGHLEIVRQLLAAGADPNQTDWIADQNKPASLSFIYNEGGMEAVESMGITLGRTALMCAAQGGQVEVMKVLIEAGADLNAQDAVKESALSLAAAEGQRPAMAALVQAGMNVDLRGSGRTTPIMNAVLAKDADVVRFLIDAGANLDLKDNDGNTALLYAIKLKQTHLVALLLEGGADPLVKDREGKTALDFVREYSFAQQSRPLVEAAAASQSSKPAPQAAKKAAPRAARKKTPSKPAAKRAPNVSQDALKHYERDEVVKRLTKNVHDETFRRIVDRLSDQCGAKPIPLGDDTPLGYSLHVNARKRIDIEMLQGEVLAEGAFVFAEETDGERVERIAVIPSCDKYDALAAMGTNGANSDLETGDVIRWLMELEQEQPFVITGVEFDVVDVCFTSPIADPENLARRVYKFCPDIVDQGVGDVDALAQMLREPRPRLYFWWD